jgi:hypothetical protein
MASGRRISFGLSHFCRDLEIDCAPALRLIDHF